MWKSLSENSSVPSGYGDDVAKLNLNVAKLKQRERELEAYHRFHNAHISIEVSFSVQQHSYKFKTEDGRICSCETCSTK